MSLDDGTLAARVTQLERRTRRTELLAIIVSAGVLATWVTGAIGHQESLPEDAIRTKLLVIEDDQSRERIVLGAPMPDGREYVGMKILNPDGAEQFGLGLRNDGSVSMGFDAKPGVGNPANRERLNMGVNTSGRGWIRYLDNETRARMWVRLDSDDTPVVQFLDWPDGQRILVRQMTFEGDQSLKWKR